MNTHRTIGLDIHRDRIYVTELSLWDITVKQYEITTGEKDLKAFLATLGRDDQVALEATRGSNYYVSRLSGLVASVSVANPSKLQFFNKNAKNDRNDSFNLALLLCLGILPTVWTPDQETLQDREILNYRHSLIQQQTRIKNRIRAQMAEHGLTWDGSDLTSACSQRFLMTLKNRLPWASKEVLTNQLEELELIEQRLQRLEPVIEVRAGRWPEVALLMTIRGINVLTAFTIIAIIGRIDRFATADSLANYAGLVPRQRSSAGKSRNGSITKAGSKRLRWALTEAVQSLCMADGPYRNLCKRLERKKKGKGIAATACARKLLTAIWCMLTRNEPFRHAEPKLVEDKAQRRERRLNAARLFVEEQKKRQHPVIQNQLALVQEMASRRALIPIPRSLQATFGRLALETAAVATG
jgi:transposase